MLGPAIRPGCTSPRSHSRPRILTALPHLPSETWTRTSLLFGTAVSLTAPVEAVGWKRDITRDACWLRFAQRSCWYVNMPIGTISSELWSVKCRKVLRYVWFSSISCSFPHCPAYDKT